ncbi:MAG: DUF4167 domain-containing protein [Variibacter sp.]|nr:DUF4167 domain-containing protein [Variibacter sp.]
MRNGPSHHHSHSHGHNKQRMRGRNRKGQNPLTRVYESNGPDVKVRGTANHIAEKYLQLARDSSSSGDPVAAENYYQHAEHYFRLIVAVQEQFRQSSPYPGEAREGAYEGEDDDAIEQGMGGEPFAPREQSQPYQQREHQPYPQREGRFNRDRDRGERDRGERDRGERGERDRERADRGERDQQPQQRPQPQPIETAEDHPDIERLPAFVTGVAAPPAPAGNGAPAQNGFEGQPDRFPLHRRRRRRGPRAGAHGGGEANEAAGPAGE